MVNTRILGNTWRKTNWQIRLDTDKTSQQCVSEQSMPNNHCRKFLDDIELITEYCISDGAERKSWTSALTSIEKW